MKKPRKWERAPKRKKGKKDWTNNIRDVLAVIDLTTLGYEMLGSERDPQYITSLDRLDCLYLLYEVVTDPHEWTDQLTSGEKQEVSPPLELNRGIVMGDLHISRTAGKGCAMIIKVLPTCLHECQLKTRGTKKKKGQQLKEAEGKGKKKGGKNLPSPVKSDQVNSIAAQSASSRCSLGR